MRILDPRGRALAGFAAFGVYWGAFGAALPALQRRTETSDAELGVALLVLAGGAVVSMRGVGVLMDRVGARLTPVVVGGFGLAGLAAGLADSASGLSVLLLVVGLTSGAMDVVINAEAVHAEEASGRPLLNLAHAFFSGAVVAASLGAGLLRWAGAEPPLVFALAAGVVLGAALGIAMGRSAWTAAAAGDRPRLFQRVPAWLLLLGGLGALAYWIENAWQSWGAVHLERTLDAAPLTSALGPALFAAAMTAGRLTVHRFSRPRAERAVLVGGAALAGLGSLLAASAPSVAVALPGIVLAGAGCSVCAPTIVSIAGRAAGRHERATVVGSLTTIMYLGFLVGPAAVGGVAELTTLRISLAVVAALAVVLAGLFAVVRFPAPRAG
jgi:MFS family permease